MLIEEQVSLAPYTTLRIGGPARFFATIRTCAMLLEALAFARERSVPIAVLGGGSNLLVRDSGFPGLVLHLSLTPLIAEIPSDDPSAAIFEVSAGTDWDALVLHVCERGLAGMECLAGIPGLVGGSPIQNIGAYGQEVAQTISRVTAFDLHTLSFVELNASDCRFRYRESIFNRAERGRYLITSVRFRLLWATQAHLSYADLAPLRKKNPSPLEVFHAVRDIRKGKGMLIDPARLTSDTRSAGSFFKNPLVPASCPTQIARQLAIDVAEIPCWPASTDNDPEALKISAAWLIERAGFAKGFVLGPVGISSRHTLALVNRSGSATCADLLCLRDAIIRKVAARFDITLEQEPVFLG